MKRNLKKFNFVIKPFYLLIIFLSQGPATLYAVNKGIYLDEIVVYEESGYESSQMSGFNTIITREDMERSSARTLFDILEKENSVSIRSNTGGDRFSVIDLRGMGETAGSNLLVVMDGFIINGADMSGQGLSDLPLEIIESVEIIRSGGVVSNGGGAVTGVIKITTRKPEKDRVSFNLEYGSNGLSEKNLLAMHKDDIQSLFLNALIHDYEGYRENGFYDKKTLDISYENSYPDSVKAGLKLNLLKDEYGLPGAVSIEELEDENRRRDTGFPDDDGSTSRKKGIIYLEKDFEKIGTLSISRIYEYRDNTYIMGYSPLIAREDQESKISSVSKDLRAHLEKKGDSFFYKIGGDWFFDDYIRDSKSEDLRKNGRLESKDIYFLSGFHTDSLKMSFGYRFSETDSKFREDLFLSANGKNGDEINDSYTNQGIELGAGYRPFKNTDFELFCNFTKAFRNPNIDELALSTGKINAQESLNYEAGIEYSSASHFSGGVSYFYMISKDEIYYGQDANGGRYNKNYNDNIVRKGLEARIGIYPLSSLFLKLGTTLMSAEFQDSKKSVPLVSEIKVSGFVEYELLKNIFISGEYSYYSEMKQGGDIDNRLKKIPSFSVVDASLNYKVDNFSFFMRVNNLLNELYTTASYENSCYPMPEREFVTGIRMEF